MSVFQNRPLTRWAAPVVALAMVGGGVALSQAEADGGLPPKTAEQLLVDLQKARVEQYQGTIRSSVDLGLGSITQMAGAGTEFSNLVDGTNTLRVWADGPERQRVALLGEAGEADLIRHGRTLWAWNAQDKTAVQTLLPAADSGHADAKHPSKSGASKLPATPQEAAEQVLAHLDPTTAVSTSGFATVAGRSAYALVLTPRTTDTLVGRVVIDLDGQTSMPLRVQVDGKGADKPAVSIGFTSLELAAPKASVFTFTPPKDAKVTTHDATKHPDKTPAKHPGSDRTGAAKTKPSQAASTTTVGSGWSSVVVTKLPADALAKATANQGRGDDSLSQVLGSLPTASGAWGQGKVFQGTLFTAVLTTDGRLAVGPVPAAQVEKALGTKAATSLVPPA